MKSEQVTWTYNIRLLIFPYMKSIEINKSYSEFLDEPYLIKLRNGIITVLKLEISTLQILGMISTNSEKKSIFKINFTSLINWDDSIKDIHKIFNLQNLQWKLLYYMHRSLNAIPIFHLKTWLSLFKHFKTQSSLLFVLFSQLRL